MDLSLGEEVRRRANDACEYCRMPQAYYPTVPFPVDHVIARQHGGPTALNNLAVSCLHCNSHKGPNIAGLDPKTRKLTPLFNPRRHKWSRHFRWSGSYLIGRTAVGRTTVEVLAMNHPDVIEVREELIEERLFPPT
jgi:HNH endonuclease